MLATVAASRCRLQVAVGLGLAERRPSPLHVQAADESHTAKPETDQSEIPRPNVADKADSGSDTLNPLFRQSTIKM